MPPLDESCQGGAELIDTHPRCSFKAQAVAHATRSPLSPRTKAALPRCMDTDSAGSTPQRVPALPFRAHCDSAAPVASCRDGTAPVRPLP
jgi:hypothetical protein